MAKTNSYAVILAATAIASGTTTKAAPAYATSAINIQPNYGTGITIMIQNGATAPGAAMQAQVQVSGDGATWRDFGPPVAGDTVNASAAYTWAIDVPHRYLYARVVAWGHTTNSVTLAVETQETVSL
jgi:uncharacterized membrane protein